MTPHKSKQLSADTKLTDPSSQTGVSRRTLLQSAVVLLGSAALIANPMGAFAKDSKTIVVAVPQYPSALEPILRNNTSTLQTIYSVYDRLLTIDFRTGELSPGLAESWEKINDTTYEFVLRDGLKFSDGSPVTASDVVFSFSDERILGPQGDGATVASQYHRTIEAVEALDDKIVRVMLKRVDPTILFKLGGWGTEIVSEKAFRAVGGWDGWADSPVGAGPYRIADHRQDEYLILEANEYYWRGEAPFERIEFRVIPESVVRVSGLIAGDFDLTTFVSPDQIAQINGADELGVVGGPAQNVRFLGFFQTEGVFTDPIVRRAVTHAIDRDLIVESIWRGRTEVAPGFQHPVYGDLFLEDIKPPKYDPDLARSLLEESSYNGEEVIYRTQTSAYPLELETAQIILEMLRAIGFNIRLKVLENWAQVKKEPTGSALFNSSALIAWPDPTGGMLRRFGPDLPFSKPPYTWINDEFYKLAEEFAVEPDLERRRAIHQRLQDIWQNEDPGGTVLFYNALFYGKKDEVSWEPLPTLYGGYGPFEQS